jgi:hypothetical protein
MTSNHQAGSSSLSGRANKSFRLRRLGGIPDRLFHCQKLPVPLFAPLSRLALLSRFTEAAIRRLAGEVNVLHGGGDVLVACYVH